MGKPVIQLIVGNLLLPAAIGSHTPDLHQTGTNGIEIDIPSVRGIFRAIVQSLCIRQAYLLSSRCRYLINIEFAVTLRAEYQVFPIRRPSMQVRWSFWCDLFGDAAADRYGI